MKPWTAPDPKLETSKDVRRLIVCGLCQRMSFSLARFEAAGGHGAHIYCIAKKFGMDVVKQLRKSELGKATLDEMVALGGAEVWNPIWAAAGRRELMISGRMPMSVGEGLSDLVSWTWTRSWRRWEATLTDRTDLIVERHKVRIDGGWRRYWTGTSHNVVQTEAGGHIGAPLGEFESAGEAKLAAVNSYRRHKGLDPL